MLTLMARDFNEPEIETRLGTAASAVGIYRQRIANKFGVAHRSDDVRFAVDVELLGATVRDHTSCVDT